MIFAAFAAAAIAGAPPIAEPTPNLYHQPAYCHDVVSREVERQKVAFNGQVPAAEYAVMRTLGGCGVPTPVGYHPSYLQPGAATADPPPKREDAPSNRR
ncbi:hypothetical protein [Phenylobacterium sp.]|uniref:hypothetical protein n=1 Tax=Phenylobacterium sp. TaxID=1871053 RepID=UPI001202CDF9|nr:hypothetical protein [Phenylobacterium sp.]THD57760.1 MAG: hypothetical protein E8A49_21365 [Phenylobacterium sp.]